jgi:hypothetical protein
MLPASIPYSSSRPAHLLESIHSTAMPDSKARQALLMYVDDVLALERDLQAAVQRQVNDDHVLEQLDAASLIKEIALFTETRITALAELSHALGGRAGVMKEVMAAATGVLTGLYGRMRKDSVSRTLRDDYTALALVATAYSMLYTASIALRNEHASTVAQRNLCSVTPLVMQLSRLIPEVVAAELAVDHPGIDTKAVEVGREATLVAWSQGRDED